MKLMENEKNTGFPSSPDEMSVDCRERIRKELENARCKNPLNPEDFTDDEIKALKELAPGEYDHLMKQMERKDGISAVDDEKG